MVTVLPSTDASPGCFTLSCWFPEPCHTPVLSPSIRLSSASLLNMLAVPSWMLTQTKSAFFIVAYEAPSALLAPFLQATCPPPPGTGQRALTRSALPPPCTAPAVPASTSCRHLTPPSPFACQSPCWGTWVLLGSRSEIPLQSGTILVQSHLLT